MKRRILSMILVLCMVFTLIPSTVFAEVVDRSLPIGASGTKDSGNAVGDNQINKMLDLSSVVDNVDCTTASPSGNGHIHSDNMTCWAWYTNGKVVDDKAYTGNVLVLDGVDLVCTTDTTGFSLPDNTTIVTTMGSFNTVTAAANDSGDSYGIYGAGDLTFDGKGTLNVTGGTATGGASYGIYAVGHVRINGGIVNATGATTSSSGGDDTYTVSFDSKGGPAIEPMTVAQGGTLTELPVPGKSGSVFTSWYQGDTPVGTDTEFYADTTLVANYETLSGNEIQYTDTTFTQSEAMTDLKFTVNASGKTAEQVKSALTLAVLDNSGDITLDVTESGGSFTVSAIDGFTPGGAYRLTLGDGLTFGDKDALIRNCEFTIKRAEVFNIEFNENLNYIQMENLTDITQNGKSVQELNSSLFQLTTDGGGEMTKNTGTFKLTSGTLGVGEVVCLHSGNKPEAGNDEGFINDNIAYVKIIEVNDGVYTYVSAEPEEVLLMPDVLPVSDEADTDSNKDNNSITVEKATFDYSDTKYAEAGLNIATTVDKGDFLFFYSGTYGTGASMIGYGRVTSVDLVGGYYIVDYDDANEEDIQNAVNYYSEHDINADKLIKGVDVAALEQDIERQAMDSGFAQAAASFLAAAATETEGFGGAVKGFDPDALYVELEDGSEISLFQMRVLSSTVKPVLTNLEVKALITTNGDHFGKGSLQCSLDVSFSLALVDKEGQGINLTVKATFVEELKMGVNVSGKTIWKWKWIFPYIDDYQFNANLDVYNYTYIKLEAQVTTRDGYTIADISNEMKSILEMTNGDEIKSGVSKLFELYGDMIDADSDWVDVFEKEISKTDMRLLLGVINVRITTSFVVSVDMKVALGMEFEYISGDRYCFWLKIKAKDAGSETIRLIDQKSTFQFYVMGSIGVRAGVKIELAVGLFSVDLASVGLGAETGAYVRLNGYFFYTTSSTNGVITSSNTAGALYMEMGVYLDLTFTAQALGGKYKYSPSLFYKEWPILKAGKQKNIYDFKAADGLKNVNLKKEQKTFTLPSGYYNLLYLDLKEGDSSETSAGEGALEITSTNPAVKVNGNNITVTPPEGARYVNVTITVRYKNGQLAFTSMPITRTLNVHWDDLDNPYHITFAGGGISTITADYETTITAPANPTRVGYTFGGWYTDAGCTNAYTFPATMPGENVTLYAKWLPQQVSYTVEHYQQGLKGGNPVLVDTETLTALTDVAVTPTFKSYPGFTKPAGQTATINGDGSTVVKFIYTRNSYTLTFLPGHDSLSDIVRTVPFEGAIIPPAMAREGYTFTGWNQAPAATMPAGNVTYTAQWTVNTYNVEYTLDSMKVEDQSKVYNFGSQLYRPTFSEGYNFLGWYIDAACTIPFGQTTVPARDIKLFGKIVPWHAEYTVEHYQEDLTGSTYTMVDTDDNLPGMTSATVTATPKTYIGFTYNSDIPGTIVSGKVAGNGSLVLKLYYTRNSYTVTFDGNGSDGGSMPDQTFRYGESKSLTAQSFTKTGHGFNGWNTEANGTGASYADEDTVTNLTAAANGSVTLYATWTPGEYTVTFDSNKGSGSTTPDEISPACKAVTFGADYDTLPTLSRKGYTFVGWYTTAIGGTEVTNTTKVETGTSHTLYARWTANTYTVTFDGNGSTGGSMEAQTLTYDAAQTLIANGFTRTRYIFIGWNTEANGTGTSYGDGAEAINLTDETNGSVTLYAQWEATGNDAQIGEKKYVTLQEAFDAAQENDTIQLLQDVSLTETMNIAAENATSFTLDLNGKKIESTTRILEKNGSGKLTITDSVGDGLITSLTGDSSYMIYMTAGELIVNSGTVESTSGWVIYCTEGKVTVKGGTVRSLATRTGLGGAIYSRLYGNVTLTGGTISATQAYTIFLDGRYGGKLIVSDNVLVTSANSTETSGTIYIQAGISSDTLVEITGGTIENTWPTGNAIYRHTGSGADVSIPSGAPVIRGGGMAMNVAPVLGADMQIKASTYYDASYISAYNSTKITSYKYLTIGSSNAVARIGTKDYGTLNAAISAAQSGDTIQILEDIGLTETARITAPTGEIKSLTLDLQGKTLTGGNIYYEGGGTLTIDDTIGGGKITSNTYTLYLPNSGTVVVKGGTVENTAPAEGSASSAINTNGTASVIVKGGKVRIANTGYAIDHHGTGSVTMTGGEVDATGIYCHGIRNYGTGSVSVTGGTVIGKCSAIYNESTGEITIGGTAIISSDSTAYSTVFLNKGTTSDIVLEITSGTIVNTAENGIAVRFSDYANPKGRILIKEGSSIIRGVGSAMNTAPELGDSMQVTASADYEGTDQVTYDGSNITNYKYLAFDPLMGAKVKTVSPSAIVYDAQTEQQISISNTDLEEITVFSLTLGDSNILDDAVILNADSLNAASRSLAPMEGCGIYGSSITITGGTVTAAGDKAMSAQPDLTGYIGYTATASIKIDGLDAVTYNPTDFDTYQYIRVEPVPSYGIKLSQSGTHNFPSATVGYATQAPLTVTVSNSGNQATGDLTVALSGGNAGSFTLSAASISSIAASGNELFTVAPNTGLEEGTYISTVTVSGDNGISASFIMNFTVAADSATPVPDPTPSYPNDNTETTKGKVEKTQQQDDGAPTVNVNNSGDELKARVLTPQEQEIVVGGVNAKVILKVTDINTSVSEEEKKLIEEKLVSENGNANGSVLYVDLSLYKQIGNQEQIQVTETKGKISISIEVPERFWNTDVAKSREFYVIRIHNGEAIRIEGSYDAEKHLFTFETDRFSTYALTYQDTIQIQTYHDFHHLQLKAKAAKTSQTLSYKRIANVDGYLIYGAKCGEEMKKLAEVSADIASYTVKKLKQGTNYKYQVKAYRMIDKEQVIIMTSKVVHSSTESKKYGNPTKVTTDTASVMLAAGKSKTVTCQVVLPKDKKLKEHTAVIRYESSNKEVATVNSKGKITAKAKGTCYVYAYAQNGVYKRIKVTVK